MVFFFVVVALCRKPKIFWPVLVIQKGFQAFAAQADPSRLDFAVQAGYIQVGFCTVVWSPSVVLDGRLMMHLIL